MYEQTTPERRELDDSAIPKTIPAIILLPGEAVVEYKVKYEIKKAAHDVTVNKMSVLISLFPLTGFTSYVNSLSTEEFKFCLGTCSSTKTIS